MKTIIIDTLEVCLDDLGEMTWQEATQSVNKLGPGWRLPTIEEFQETLYPNRDRIFGDDTAYYWSSMENTYRSAWFFTFSNGDAYIFGKASERYALAVRDWNAEIALELLLKDF